MTAAATVPTGCAVDASFDEPVDEIDQEIRNGEPAHAYPEAVLIDDFCSGALITPRVVLTAAHCVAGVFSGPVTAPFAGPNATAEIVDHDRCSDGNAPDVGLFYLDRPIALARYPKVARTRAADGSRAVIVGRNNDRQFSSTRLFRATYKIERGAGDRNYVIDESVLRAGDSGGPDFAAHMNQHVIIAVNVQEHRGKAYLGRVDRVTSCIRNGVEAHGGFSAGGGFADVD